MFRREHRASHGAHDGEATQENIIVLPACIDEGFECSEHLAGSEAVHGTFGHENEIAKVLRSRVIVGGLIYDKDFLFIHLISPCYCNLIAEGS